MGELGIPELLIILAILLVLFGPSRLAGLGRTLGQGIREFRTSMRGETTRGESKAAADSEPPTAHA
ncbi:twin-arginine translocase TatA/TatE family subunit [Chloroflexia bacterium SDU3-3]|nr:twin-arginine translocase TatA/TatE family subunit [Chloroflexia bacterium SDU3-3]